MPDSKNGWDAALGIVNECVDLLDSGNDRVILAGDFNHWPEHIVPVAEKNLELVDIMGLVKDLPELKGAVGGSRIWTHKNGNKNPGGEKKRDNKFSNKFSGSKAKPGHSFARKRQRVN
jgi:hypothetical protein